MQHCIYGTNIYKLLFKISSFPFLMLAPFIILANGKVFCRNQLLQSSCLPDAINMRIYPTL